MPPVLRPPGPNETRADRRARPAQARSGPKRRLDGGSARQTARPHRTRESRRTRPWPRPAPEHRSVRPPKACRLEKALGWRRLSDRKNSDRSWSVIEHSSEFEVIAKALGLGTADVD